MRTIALYLTIAMFVGVSAQAQDQPDWMKDQNRIQQYRQTHGGNNPNYLPPDPAEAQAQQQRQAAAQARAENKNPNLPKCDNSNILRTLKQIVADSPAGRQGLLELKDIDHISEGYSSTFNYRLCMAMFYTNADSEMTNYSLYLDGDKHDKLRVKILPNDNQRGATTTF
ncbi:MAG TPA: hypothetical protein VGG48_02965 [Rhizomicrobium sp.]|jgi:hypothetical protein